VTDGSHRSAGLAFSAVVVLALVLTAQASQEAHRLEARKAAKARVDALIDSFKKVTPANPSLAAELRALRDDDQRFRVEGMRLWTEKGVDSPEARAVWDKQSVLDARTRHGSTRS
jgi:hypothetical protein